MKYVIQVSTDETSFRLLDTDTNKVEVYTSDELSRLKEKPINITIDNIKDIKGTNGSIDRYKENRIVILFEVIGNKGNNVIYYNISDSNGNRKDMTPKEVIALANKVGIANGKLVGKDGEKFISTIFGKYPTIQIDNTYSTKNEVGDRLRYILFGLENYLKMVLGYKCAYKKIETNNIGVKIKIEQINKQRSLEFDIIDTENKIVISKGDSVILSIKIDQNFKLEKEDLKAIGMDISRLIMIVNNTSNEQEALNKVKKKEHKISFFYINTENLFDMLCFKN